LSKTYGKDQVLKNLDWNIEQGDIVGLLGKNGAGKSTLLKGLLNLSDNDSGTVTIFGEDHLNLSSNAKSRIGYVPQVNDEIPWLTVNELIKFRKRFYTNWSDEKVAQLVELWEINLDKKMGELSPGQAQRVLIILALAPMPELLIFDEPAAALDPAARRSCLKEIVTLAREAAITVIFSTHITSDLERIANKVAILDKGHICYFDNLDDTKENVVRLSIIHQPGQQIDIPNVLHMMQEGSRTQCVVSTLDSSWLTQMKEENIDINISPLGLEDIFLEITQ
jgi:ABC-2 type transport system ATP-binding protein